VEPLVLLRGVREVAALANPEEPTAATQRAFDAARARSQEPAALPAARRITERLRLPWTEVLAVAYEPEARQAQLVGVKTRASPAVDWITAEHVAAALQLVAQRRGAHSLTTGEYRVDRARLLEADRARWFHGRWLLLPDDEQVIAAAGSWDAALRLAGLETTAERGPSRQPSAPTLADLLERFHDAHGFQPSSRELRAFARGNGVAYPSERAQRFGAAVAEWRRQRRERGLSEPSVIQRAGGRGNRAPDYSADVGAARDGDRRRAKWTRASCAAAVTRYLAQLPNGERSTERGYADWAAAQPSGTAPAMSTILALGGWEAVRRDAQTRVPVGEGLCPDSANFQLDDPQGPADRGRRTNR
jgi:hypothetical protein